VEGEQQKVFTNNGCRCMSECRKRLSSVPMCNVDPGEDCPDQQTRYAYRLECGDRKPEFQLVPPTFCAGVMDRVDLTKKAHWTHLVYMNADNDLESDAMDDLAEMLQMPSGSISLLVLVDRSDPHAYHASHKAIHQLVICPEAYPDINLRTVRQQFSNTYELLMIGDPYDGQNSTSRRRWLLRKDWNEADMDNQETLRVFIRKALKDFPAYHFALTLWDHGVGRKGFGGDSQSGQSGSLMTLFSLEQAIRGGISDAGMPDGFRFDLLSFDACLMSSYEVISALSSHGHYFLGSETIVSGAGWDWRFLRPTTYDGKPTTPLDYAKSIAHATVDFHMRQQDVMPLAIVDLYKQREFRMAFAASQRSLTERLNTCFDTYEVDRIRTAYQRADNSLRAHKKSLFPQALANPVDMGRLLHHLEAEVERVMPLEELDTLREAYRLYNESIVYFNGSNSILLTECMSTCFMSKSIIGCCRSQTLTML